MAYDKQLNDPQPEPDSPAGDDIDYSDWASPAGSMIEARIDSLLWPRELVDPFAAAAPNMLDAILADLDAPPAMISLSLCGDAEIHQLNHQHRGFDKPTNVLSFAAYDPAEIPLISDGGPALHAEPLMLGDIVIAAQTVAREADSQNISMADHLMHLFVHGTLHLLGHDHIDDDMAATMENLEIKYLAHIGISNPYRDAETENRN